MKRLPNVVRKAVPGMASDEQSASKVRFGIVGTVLVVLGLAAGVTVRVLFGHKATKTDTDDE